MYVCVYVPSWVPERITRNSALGTSLVVQWLRICVPNAGGLGSIPGEENRSHMPQLRPNTTNCFLKVGKKKKECTCPCLKDISSLYCFTWLIALQKVPPTFNRWVFSSSGIASSLLSFSIFDLTSCLLSLLQSQGSVEVLPRKVPAPYPSWLGITSSYSTAHIHVSSPLLNRLWFLHVTMSSRCLV